MATYKKMLKNRRGDNIIPAFGGQIDSDDIADGAITSAKIADGAISTGDIANGAVTADKMGTNAFLKRNTAAGDANNIKETGLYYLASVTANAPDANSQIYQAIVIIAGGAGAEYGHQIFINLWNNNTYIRRVENGTWGAWRQFTLS